jgi:hypothetical protein
MIQEGYMMQSTSANVSTHTQFRNKLIETIGEECTKAFYDTWLAKHFTKADLDFMKVSGFNAVRPALHYKWFTLPIEEEQKNSDGTIQNTWLEKGFSMTDSLVSWCEKNKIYLIFDMHGAPGGQGTDANISDYDTLKPSLWESEFNKLKLIALWKKLAERFKDSEWVGGYDIINEPNWALDGESYAGCGCKNNDALWDLQQRIIEGIREVDQNHMVFISGNCWGNNYNSLEGHLLVKSDQNMVITFHKYWNFNTDKALENILKLRNLYNKPIWMGEGGENSNTWFADCISLLEKHNIGWSWWPVKKSKFNNILKVITNEDYYKLIDSWKNNTPLSADDSYKAVMQYAENHKFEHCEVAKDVLYAMTEQTNVYKTKPFKEHTINSAILCADYDMGREGYAYHDTVSGDYHIDSGGSWIDWNTGNFYRNDGVDIGNDNGTPYVGWTEAGEWLQYTIDVPNGGTFDIEIISASEKTAGTITIVINGNIITNNFLLPYTNGWTNWQATTVENVNLFEGENVLKIIFNTEGSNLLDIKFVNHN